MNGRVHTAVSCLLSLPAAVTNGLPPRGLQWRAFSSRMQSLETPEPRTAHSLWPPRAVHTGRAFALQADGGDLRVA
jgi:hypothetical protein